MTRSHGALPTARRATRVRARPRLRTPKTADLPRFSSIFQGFHRLFQRFALIFLHSSSFPLHVLRCRHDPPSTPQEALIQQLQTKNEQLSLELQSLRPGASSSIELLQARQSLPELMPKPPELEPGLREVGEEGSEEEFESSSSYFELFWAVLS